LVPGQYYHVYNRGNNREDIFLETKNFGYFRRLYIKYIFSMASTYAYCLLKNHFHFLIRIREKANPKGFENPSGLNPSYQFGKMFNAYAKAINKAYGRTGSLFQHPFKRVHIPTQTHLLHLVIYIHQNPQTHGLVNDFKRWPYSSFPQFLRNTNTFVDTKTLISWFGGLENLIDAHRKLTELDGLKE
jgi:putative transposase